MLYDVVDFQKDVVEASAVKPVLVDFWAQWCGPCRMLGPLLEKLAAEYADRWTLVKVETDKHPEISAEYGVRGIPNVKLFRDGKVVDEFTGALPERVLRSWLEKAVPNPLDQEVEQAVELLKVGQALEARELLQSVLEREPHHEAAAAHLARSLAIDDPIAAGELVAGIYENSAHFELADSVRTLAALARHLPDGERLPEADVREAYMTAISSLFNKEFDQALEALIDIIRLDRYYDDDGARKACIALFKLLGEDNEITLRHRRSFDGALY